MSIKNDLKTLGKNIKESRMKNGLSKFQLAKKSRVNISTIARLERGIGNPLISTLYKISLALKTDLYILYKGI